MRKSHVLILMGSPLLLMACDDASPEMDEVPVPEISLLQEPIKLGKKLENPYSVANMRKAFAQMNGTLKSASSEDLIVATHLYVKFKPLNDDDLDKLHSDTTINYYSYPLDYELSEGEYYHDPELPDDVPTYQYASVPVGHEFPDVEYEILEELFIPYDDSDEEEAAVESGLKSSEWLDWALWESLEDVSLMLTGNYADNETDGGLKASKWRPSGRITYYDDVLQKTLPLEGVKVRARRFFTTHTGITNADGYYKCDGRFRYKANYSIKWERSDYEIRPNTGLRTAQYDGPKRKSEWNVDIKEGNQWYYASIFRACHFYYNKDIDGISRPPRNGFFRTQLKLRASNKVKQINGCFTKYHALGLNSHIDIYLSNSVSSQIFATTIHELTHAAHWRMDKSTYRNCDDIVKESWARGVQWWLTRKIYPNYYIKQYCRGEYTGIVQDLIDGFKQQTSLCYNDEKVSKSYMDEVSGYTIIQIHDALKGVESWDEWMNNIINKYDNKTEQNVEKAFDFWISR